MDKAVAQVVEEFRSQKDDQLAELLEAMAASAECSKVWRAIEKRLGEAAKRHEDMLRISFSGLSADRMKQFSKIDIRSEIEDLTYVVELALRNPRFCDSATVAQRRSLEKKFSQASALIIKILAQLERAELGEDQVGAALWRFARSTSQEACESLRDNEMGINVDKNAETVAEFVAMGCVAYPEKLVDQMRGGVAEWARTKPLLPRPNGTNAKRLRLIRELSDHFKSKYGTPLRACVLAITGVFFDTEGLDEAAIATLAP